MKKTLTTLALGAMLLSAGGHPLAAQQKQKSQVGNVTVIPVQQARQTALAKVPNKTGIISEKLKSENGVLVYEFDIETPGPGHQEVDVGAIRGDVLSSLHEEDLVGRQFTSNGVTDTRADMDNTSAMSRPRDRVFTPAEAGAIHPLISEAQARSIAEKMVPEAPVKDVDLETENGVLVYDVDLDTPGSGHAEVMIDATTGKVLRLRHK